MKNRLLSGIALLVLGTFVALAPVTLFPVCAVEEARRTAEQETVPASMAHGQKTVMKCFWTARAELGTGGLIALLGILLIVLKSPQTRIGISISAALNGILVLLLPTVLIGVCSHAGMACRSGTLPALMVLGSFVIAAALLNALYLYKTGKKETRSA